MFKKIYEFYLFINPTFKFYRDLDTEYGQVNNNDNVNNNPKVCGDNFLNQNKEKEMFDRYNIFIKIYREDDYIKKLRKEILESNGIISNIGVRGLDSLKNNRTIVAYDDITKNFEVLNIPNHLILSKFNPKIYEFCLTNKISLDTDYDCLLAYLLQEQIHKDINPSNLTMDILHNYLNSLPNDFSTFPFNYNENELNLLKGTYFIKRLDIYKKEFEQLYEKFRIKYFHDLNTNINLDPNYPKKRFKNFYLTLFSRSFGLDTEQGTFDALVPYGDMFNTSINDKERSCFWYFDDDKNFHVEAGRDIKKDEEICIRYGDGYNSDFLMFYGFTVDENKNGKIENFDIKDEENNLLCEICIKTIPSIRDYNLEKIKQKILLSLNKKEDDLYCIMLIKINLSESLQIYKKYEIENLKSNDEVNSVNYTNIKRIIQEEKLVIETNLKFVESIIKYITNEVTEESDLNLGELSCYDIDYLNKAKCKF